MNYTNEMEVVKLDKKTCSYRTQDRFKRKASIFITELESGLKLHVRCHDTRKKAAIKL